jgi:hypothetical protein
MHHLVVLIRSGRNGSIGRCRGLLPVELEATGASSLSGVSIPLKSISLRSSVRPELDAATELTRPRRNSGST